MPKTIALITIHGMGDTPDDYYTDIREAIKKSVGKATWERIIFKPLYYQDIIQGQQRLIFNRMRTQIDWMKLRRFLLFGFSDAGSLEYKREVQGSPYYLTQEMILKSMDGIFSDAGNKPIPVVLLAQSLGCQVISNYIWDSLQNKATSGVWSVSRNDGVAVGSPQDQFRRMHWLYRLYTTGCNIPIFVAGHKKIEAFTPKAAAFKWHNFFDEDDVLGWPLRPLSDSYDKLVEDIPVNAGGGVFGTITSSWNPLSHGHYWSDREVTGHLSATLKQLA